MLSFSCRLFYKFGRQHNAALRQWYSIGVAVAAMLGMSVVFMLLQDVWLAVAWIKEVCPDSFLLPQFRCACADGCSGYQHLWQLQPELLQLALVVIA